MVKRAISLALIIGLLLTVIAPVSVQAQGELTIVSSSTRVQFPASIVFNLSARSSANISDVRLHYEVMERRFAQITSEAYIDIVPALTIDAQWTWDMRKTGGLPPGAIVRYWWTVKDERGNKIATSPATIRFEDNRYSWRSLEQGQVTLYWYQGGESFARELMTSVQQALLRLEKDTGARLDQPVRLYVYGDTRDVQGAMVFPQEWTGGAAFTSHGIVIIGISPAMLDWGRRAITHELTHLTIHQMTFNPYNSIPNWLDEGLAMYNEGPLTSQFTVPLNNAIAKNSLISVRSLSSPFSAFGDTSTLSYAESHSLVQFVINKYGQSKMFRLLLAFKEGSGYDEALQQVYGFDMDGLDTQWRNSLLSPSPAPTSSRSSSLAPVVASAIVSPGLLVALALVVRRRVWKLGQ